jgi:flavin-dependent dehydrogenase
MVDPCTESPIKTDICILGGGPSGSTLANRLRQLGYSVVIVEKLAFPRPHIGESLLGSILPLFDLLGVSNEIAKADFLRPKSTIVRWSNQTQRKESPNEPGFQVERARFDHILLRAAQRLGAVVLQPARALSMQQHENGSWRLIVRCSESDLEIECNWVADATGRTGNVACSQRRRLFEKTLALYAYWRDVPLASSETRIDFGDDEWYWGAPLPGNMFNATVFVDASEYRKRVKKAGGIDALYETLIPKSKLLGHCVRGLRIGPVKGCDATPFYDDQPATTNKIKVGEAAFSIDPLSSQGIQVAMGSGIHAAAVIHTIVQRPSQTELALEFYRMRQLESVTLHANSAAMFYREIARCNSSEFWHRRAALTHGLRRNKVEELERSPLTTGMEIKLAPEVQFKTLPTLQGDFIVRSRAVTFPALNSPLAFLNDVEVAPLLAMIENPLNVHDLLSKWEQQLPMNRGMAVLQWLWERGVIRSSR